MKTRIIAIISLLLAMTFLFCACGNVKNSDGADDNNVDEQLSDTQADANEEKNEENDESDTDKEEKRAVKNILMIGNSNCYYYVEELVAVASAAGHDINLCNLYYSGCNLAFHWSFYSENQAVYQLFLTNSEGRVETSVKTFQGALDYAKENLGGDWDVITLQQSGYPSLVGTLQTTVAATEEYADKLYDVIRTASPEAKLYWHQPWAYEIGYGASRENPSERVLNADKQNKMHEIRKSVAKYISTQQKVDVIPTGDAWQIARTKAAIKDTLCERILNGRVINDCDHDGDVGGGQYLNACVWFEVLFGESCVGNTWRPDYDLSETKIKILQQAAHQAVAEFYGSDYTE